MMFQNGTKVANLNPRAAQFSPESGGKLLRISIEQDHNVLLFVLEGRLVGPWVDELRRVREQHASSERERRLTVDLCGLTAMDTAGRDLLEELLQRGATIRCSDVMNQYLVEQMGGTGGRLHEACRPCRAAPESIPLRNFRRGRL